MRILSVTAQKPDSTGSGVFLTELVKGFKQLNCTQAVICGGTQGDDFAFPAGVAVYPVLYGTQRLPFPVCGMSDEMPYESSRFRYGGGCYYVEKHPPAGACGGKNQ